MTSFTDNPLTLHSPEMQNTQYTRYKLKTKCKGLEDLDSEWFFYKIRTWPRGS